MDFLKQETLLSASTTTSKYYRRASEDIIKSGGHKISARQIETEFLAHPHIADCAVVGLPDPVWGQIVAAVLVSKESGKLKVDGLKPLCKEHAVMAPYCIPNFLNQLQEGRRRFGPRLLEKLVNRHKKTPSSFLSTLL